MYRLFKNTELSIIDLTNDPVNYWCVDLRAALFFFLLL